MKEEEEEQESSTGHQVPSAQRKMEVDPEELAVQQRLREHQDAAPKLGAAVEVRSLVEYNHGYAVMSTNSGQFPGTPSGSVVGFAPDAQGRPLFFFSKMSTHTQDLLKDTRCSLTVASKEFKGAADGRVNLMGECAPVTSDEELEEARQTYMKKHPGAFWISFGDFTLFRMEVQNIRYVGGFARAGSVTGEQYADAKPDPVQAIQGRVSSHMNDDHRDATTAIVQNYVGLDVEDAEITSLDSLGMYVKVSRTPKAAGQMQQFKIRVPWIRTIENPKDVKGVIVEMTQASAEFMPAKDEKAAQPAS
jgi:putative heme iron utilization protein